MDIKNLEKKGEDIKEWFKKEISALRTGRATPALIEDIPVESYGSKTPLKHVASITADDARTLRISPWDASILPSIEKAIIASNVGLAPIADKQTIRLSMPELTEDRRKTLIKVLSEKVEEAKITLRKERDEVWRDIQEKEKNGEIREDDKFRLKESMEKAVGKITEGIEEIASKKELEIKG